MEFLLRKDNHRNRATKADRSIQTDGTGIDLPFQPCPKCKKSVLTRLQYCPFCGTELTAQLAVQLSADALNQLFGVLAISGEGVSANARPPHEQAKDRLCEVGEKLGYQAIPEYEVRVRSKRRSLIDVVWLSGDHVVAAFEVRSKRRNLGISLGHKDRDELTGLQAQHRFLVNVSKTTGKAYFHRLQANSTVEYAPVSGEAYSYIEEMRRDYPKAFEAWTPEEDELLARRFREGIQVPELAKIHQRTPWAIQLRLERLGLLPPRNSHG